MAGERHYYLVLRLVGFRRVSLTVLELTMRIRLASNAEVSLGLTDEPPGSGLVLSW